MLAAATLFFLIALPIVNCRHRNVFSIEELGEHFSAKDYDQGKRDKGMNQAINAHSKGDRGIITRTESLYSKQEACIMLTKLVKMSHKNEATKICQISKGDCRCDRPRFERTCNECLVNGTTSESVSLK